MQLKSLRVICVQRNVIKNTKHCVLMLHIIHVCNVVLRHREMLYKLHTQVQGLEVKVRHA